MVAQPSGRLSLANGDHADVSAALADWSADVLQLGPGRLRARVLQWRCEEMTLVQLELAANTVVGATAPRDGVTILIPRRRQHRLRVGGIPLERDEFLTARPRARLEVFVPGGDCWYLLHSMRHADLCPAAAWPVRAAPESRIAPVVRELRRLLARGQAPTSHAADCDQVREPSDGLLRSLLEASRPVSPAPVALRRRHAIAKAHAFIHANAEGALRLEDLCRIAGARPRTLEYGFREFFDTTPMGYTRSVRLSRVRQQLWQAAGGRCSIGATARLWGFAHMGQFDSHYRSLFGETPSMTLARSRLWSERQRVVPRIISP